MGRPSKPAKMIILEGNKDRRTKKELATRAANEKATLSGNPMKEAPETKVDPVAHKTFQAIRKMFKAIEKDDALYSPTINRYCRITSEVKSLESDRARTEQMIDDFKGDIEPKDYIAMMKLIISIDSQLKAKRQQLLQIEKESCMTIASALRSIPKKPEKNQSDLKKALYGS
ncbi:MAG: hypothetical protein IKO76_07305 [Butyrivibrio sp.]|nr:hypothetical protein [Butyrivibrio sp.]